MDASTSHRRYSLTALHALNNPRAHISRKARRSIFTFKLWRPTYQKHNPNSVSFASSIMLNSVSVNIRRCIYDRSVHQQSIATLLCAIDIIATALQIKDLAVRVCALSIHLYSLVLVQIDSVQPPCQQYVTINRIYSTANRLSSRKVRYRSTNKVDTNKYIKAAMMNCKSLMNKATAIQTFIFEKDIDTFKYLY